MTRPTTTRPAAIQPKRPTPETRLLGASAFLGRLGRARLYLRKITALRQLDDQRIGLAGGGIIFLEPGSQPRDFGTYDRIGAGIERRALSESLGADFIFLQPVRPAADRLLDQESQQCTGPFRRLERCARQDPVELLENGLPRCSGKVARARRHLELHLRQPFDFQRMLPWRAAACFPSRGAPTS
jgi:hypothetical protein